MGGCSIDKTMGGGLKFGLVIRCKWHRRFQKSPKLASNVFRSGFRYTLHFVLSSEDGDSTSKVQRFNSPPT